MFQGIQDFRCDETKLNFAWCTLAIDRTGGILPSLATRGSRAFPSTSHNQFWDVGTSPFGWQPSHGWRRRHGFRTPCLPPSIRRMRMFAQRLVDISSLRDGSGKTCKNQVKVLWRSNWKFWRSWPHVKWDWDDNTFARPRSKRTIKRYGQRSFGKVWPQGLQTSLATDAATVANLLLQLCLHFQYRIIPAHLSFGSIKGPTLVMINHAEHVDTPDDSNKSKALEWHILDVDSSTLMVTLW